MFFIVCIETKIQTLFPFLDGANTAELPTSACNMVSWASGARQHLRSIQVWSLHSLVWGWGWGVTFIKNLTFPHHIEMDKNYTHGRNGIIIKISFIFVELAVWKLMLWFHSSYILKYEKKCRTVAYGRIIFIFVNQHLQVLKNS